MRIWVFNFICLVLLANPQAASSQEEPAQSNLRLPTRAFTADDGLGGATITSLLKDARGFLWIGTPDELLLYDGTRFQPFRYTDRTGARQSFRRAYLYSLGEAGVFIAHEEGSHQFSLPAGQLHPVATPFRDFFVRSTMQRLTQSASIFLASTTAHSGRYDARTRKWQAVRQLPSPQLTATRVTKYGKTFLGADTGLSAQIVRLHDRATDGSSQILSFPFRPSCITRLEEGMLCLESPSGRRLWWMPNGGNLRPLATMRKPANDICAAYAADGSCYIAVGQSLLKFDPAAGAVREILREDGAPVIRSGVFNHILPDGGTLWVGSNTTGVIRILLSGPRIQHLRSDSATLNWSHGIYPDIARGKIYVGGYGGTVVVFDTAGKPIEDLTPTLNRATSTPSAYINAIEPLPDGRLIIFGGLNTFLFDPLTRGVRNLFPAISTERRRHRIATEPYLGRFSVLRTGPQEWWMSENGGAARWRLSEQKTKDEVTPELVQFIRIRPRTSEAFCQHNGAWWCAAAGSLYRFDRRGLTDSFQYPITAFATAITPDHHGRLWIGTESGIVVWKKGRVERILTTESGLPNNHVYALLADGEGRMWGSTNGGLFAVRQDDFSIRAFTGGDGLQGAEFNLGAAAKDARGRLYFGGMNGVNVVDPTVALRDDAGSPVTITRVAGADTVYYTYPGAASPPGLRLSYDRANLIISFSAPQVGSAGPQRFEYRLRAKDSLWTDIGTRRELQLFLAPGEYEIEVRVQGAVSSAAAFSVEVAPPFYLSWWFILALAAGGGIVVAVAVMRGNRRRYQRRLAALETTRRIQEEKDRISRELHDELGARAALLSHNASMLREAEGRAEILPLTTRIAETTADMLTSLRETVWTLKQEAITVESLWLRYKNFIAKTAATYGHIHFVVEEDEKLPTEPMDYARALHLLRILQEATMNAAKHADASTITVSARVNESGLRFAVSDDGRGFDVEAARAGGEGNGLYNMLHRSTEGNLRLDIRSQEGGGTTVEIKL